MAAWLSGALAVTSPGEHARSYIRTAATGSRKSTLNLAAFLLGQIVGAGRVPERVAWHVLQEAASVHVGVRDFTEREMLRTIHSGLTAGARKSRC
jgi:hypothetical protein